MVSRRWCRKNGRPVCDRPTERTNERPVSSRHITSLHNHLPTEYIDVGTTIELNYSFDNAIGGGFRRRRPVQSILPRSQQPLFSLRYRSQSNSQIARKYVQANLFVCFFMIEFLFVCLCSSLYTVRYPLHFTFIFLFDLNERVT